MARNGFTLVEVLIAMALSVLVLLPALAAFSSALKASGRSAMACRLHVAAEQTLQSAAVAARRGDASSEIATAWREDGIRVVLHTKREQDTGMTTLTATADVDDNSRVSTYVVFPPLRSQAAGEGGG